MRFLLALSFVMVGGCFKPIFSAGLPQSTLPLPQSTLAAVTGQVTYTEGEWVADSYSTTTDWGYWTPGRKRLLVRFFPRLGRYRVWNGDGYGPLILRPSYIPIPPATAGIIAPSAIGKPKIVVFTQANCPPCRRLESGTLMQPSFLSKFDVEYVDVHNRPYRYSAYNIQGTPTILRSDGVMVSGYQNEAALAAWIQQAAH